MSYKILLITTERPTGLTYHRQLVPFQYLSYEVAIAYDINQVPDETLKNYECVSFLRTISISGQTNEIVKRIKDLGLTIHFDIDDYWKLPSSHPQYKAYKVADVGKQTEDAIKGADFITTTTTYLAARIKDINENVYVVPNAIAPNEAQWEIKPTESDQLRFGYIAGVHHIRDVEILHPNLKKLWENLDTYNKFKLLPAGFNLNKHKDKLYMNEYYHYVEQVFTDNYKYIKNADYKEYLKDNNPEKNELFKNEQYQRLWGLDTFKYGALYNEIDVSLVPLEQNMFSACKSELKLIEAGFMKKAVIVSNVKPYDGLINNFNCLSILPGRNHIEWFTNIRKLIKEPNLVKDLADGLHETVREKYHINTVTELREQIFSKEIK